MRNIRNFQKKYFTKNRLDNAISKIGLFDKNNDEIYETFVDDMLYEMNAFHVNELRDWLIDLIKTYNFK